MQAARRVGWTEDEYLARELRSPTKNEFLAGEIYAMAGATLRHNTISANLISELVALVRGKPCRTFTSDQRIHVAATGLYTYADAGVVCGQPELATKDRLSLTNPLILVEVLSKSTEEYDRSEKLEHYRSIAALKDVFLVSATEPRVDHHHRLDTGQWLLSTYRQGAISVATLDGAMSLEQIYDKVDFAQEDL